MTADLEDEGEVWSALYNNVQPAYVLYCVDADSRRESVSAVHETPSRDENGEYDQKIPSLREMLFEELQAGFSSMIGADAVEHARSTQQVVQVSPKGGTLVVFDSAVMPHEVTKIVHGERIALFGFFAEERSVPSAWLDPEGAESACGPWFHDGWAHLGDERDIYDVAEADELNSR
jgi:hypothetical protein